MQAHNNSYPASAPRATLGKYRLIVRVAQGGMGDVYLAVHKGPAGFSKLNIIKELRSAFAEDGSSLAMFLDEARLAARLSHPNVVQTQEVACEDGRNFMVMEYLEGKPFHHVLKALISDGAFPWPLRVHVLCEALKGLHYAHELKDFDGTALNVVHRDFTPHNIFVTYEGMVKVLDFGIAKAVDSQETRTGVIKGKVAYMAPEQAMGKVIDRRADIYAAGVMLWEAITGRRMWPNLSEVQILVQVLQTPPESPLTVDPSIPEELSGICMRALARDPEQRFETAEQMRLELERFLESQNLRPTPTAVAEALQSGFGEERKRVQAIVETAMRELRAAAEPSLLAASSEITTHSTIRPTQASGLNEVLDLTQGQSNSGLHVDSTVASPLAPPREEASEVPTGTKSRRQMSIVVALSALAGLGLSVALGRGTSLLAPDASPAQPSVALAMTAPAAPTNANSPAAPPSDESPVAPEEISAVAPPTARQGSRPRPAATSVATNSPAPAATQQALGKSSTAESSALQGAAAARPPTTGLAATSPAPAPAPAPTVMAFNGEMSRPMMLSGRDPVYTREAREAGVEGTMVAKCIISATGSVKNCRIVKNLPFMEKSVLDALHSRKYTPVIWEGKPVSVSYVFNIRVVRPK